MDCFGGRPSIPAVVCDDSYFRFRDSTGGRGKGAAAGQSF